MLASPMPVPAVRRPFEAGAGVGDDDLELARPRARAVTSTRPPWGQGSMPCLIAFSTSVISMPGGSGASPSAGGIDTANSSRRPSRVRMIDR